MRVLAVCSGGLDSTTAATHALRVDGCETVLLYFQYGCRAEQREIEAVRRIATALDIEARFEDMRWLARIGGSTLTRPDGELADGEDGAQYAHEWVPARNLLMIAAAAALCDAQGFERIYLGLNLEESATYPDNTIEFYEKLNEVMPLATLSRPEIHNPLARMMKWQIVRYGYDIGAPIHLSWSCYRSGDVHCGRCGPCYMRQQAHRMSSLDDTVAYETPLPPDRRGAARGRATQPFAVRHG